MQVAIFNAEGHFLCRWKLSEGDVQSQPTAIVCAEFLPLLAGVLGSQGWVCKPTPLAPDTTPKTSDSE